MSRPIDADALKICLQDHYGVIEQDCSISEKFADGAISGIDAAMFEIDAAPTVPAIPLEWIEWRIAHAEREGFGAVVSMLRTVRDWWNDQRDVWQKEQEAR